MPEIRVLDSDTVNRIAAGEVVESPRSVVKELVENSLDAGARRVEVEIEGGGARLVRVSDDGCGMTEEGALLALERHATSKLVSAHDLHSIRTMGFRGEAVPAIAAVSRMTLVTRPPEASAGTRVEVSGGRLDTVEKASARPGTRIEVRHLFFNTPARRKFQRSAGAETSAIRELMADYLLAHPEVAFRLRTGRDTVLATPGDLEPGEALERILAAGERQHFVELPRATHPALPLEVWGFLAKPAITRANSRGLRLFVNRRPFYSGALCRAVLDAYRNFLPKRRWPAGVLYVEADPRAVDVNVHPTKKEVRFTGFEKLQAWLIERIREALSGHVDPRSTSVGAAVDDEEALRGAPAAGPPEAPPEEDPVPGTPRPPESPAPAAWTSPIRMPRPERAGSVRPAASAAAVQLFDPAPYRDLGTEAPDLVGAAAAAPARTPVEETAGIVRGRLFPEGVRVLGQVFSSFMIVTDEKQVFYVDQHVAHERVLFEYFSRVLREGEPPVQNLLVPLEITLSPQDTDIVRERADVLERYGFRVTVEGERAFVHSIPLFPREMPVRQVLEDMVQCLPDAVAGNAVEEQIEGMADMMSCKAALKAGDRLSAGEMATLLGRLFECEYPLTCPHGRPILLGVEEGELRRRFLRSG